MVSFICLNVLLCISNLALEEIEKKNKADRTQIMCLCVVSPFQLPCQFITKLKECLLFPVVCRMKRVFQKISLRFRTTDKQELPFICQD